MWKSAVHDAQPSVNLTRRNNPMPQLVEQESVNTAISMLQVLDHFGIRQSLKRRGNKLVGPCPLHGGRAKTHFSVDLKENSWKCCGRCKSGGRMLDFVARREDCSLLVAMRKVRTWFRLSKKGRRIDSDEIVLKTFHFNLDDRTFSQSCPKLRNQ